MTKISKSTFRLILEPVHKTYWEKAHQRLRRKISTLKSSLKRRSEENDVFYDITTEEIEQMFYACYGKECKYCVKILNIRNIACDHIVPLKKKGPSIKENLQLICKSCNTRKGPLSESDFQTILDWVKTQPEEVANYVMRKLAKGGRY
jgi:5-methylcytosine-specific restriction endonuclease McrA